MEIAWSLAVYVVTYLVEYATCVYQGSNLGAGGSECELRSNGKLRSYIFCQLRLTVKAKL